MEAGLSKPHVLRKRRSCRKCPPTPRPSSDYSRNSSVLKQRARLVTIRASGTNSQQRSEPRLLAPDPPLTSAVRSPLLEHHGCSLNCQFLLQKQPQRQ